MSGPIFKITALQVQVKPKPITIAKFTTGKYGKRKLLPTYSIEQMGKYA
jgi:hypothetical protein